MLSDGIWALRDAKGASIARRARGLERAEFVNCMVAGAVVTFVSVMVPEVSGMSTVIDRAMGDEPSGLMLTWPMVASLSLGMASLTALIIWKGPIVTDWLARRFGAKGSLLDAAMWLYLATAATIIISLGLTAFDLVAGLASAVLPSSLGYVSLAISLVSLIASFAISAALAQHLLDLTGSLRSLLFTTSWLCGCIAVCVAVWAPLYGLFGGGTS
ncbi:MAG: hypothetical protein ACRCUE_11355 [Bosea sp. (in: a-proteobacteria)]